MAIRARPARGRNGSVGNGGVGNGVWGTGCGEGGGEGSKGNRGVGRHVPGRVSLKDTSVTIPGHRENLTSNSGAGTLRIVSFNSDYSRPFCVNSDSDSFAI